MRAADAKFIAAGAVLCALRLIAGAVLPLSSDEAYYWLWSRHLAAGYFDHPPAIAYVIRAGTILFGDTAFGVRVGGIILSFAASWFVWRAGALLTNSEKVGAYACLYFNLTLMIFVETLAATPDAPSIFTSAAFIWALARVASSGDGRWWLAVGLTAGLGLLAKYSALFLGLGALVWIVFSPPMRRFLVSPWPYLGAALAMIFFAPNLWWNATHHWGTFVFQFGRIGGDHFTLRYAFEFIGAQLILATPFILALGILGLESATRARSEKRFLIAAVLWPSIAYFAWHSLHDRVQGNWPCFLYPVLAIAAAEARFSVDWSGWRAATARWSGKLAVPVAALLLVAGFTQALFGVVPMGRKDPLARLLAVGLPEVTSQVEVLREQTGANAILTTDYASTAWVAFYTPAHAPVVQIGEEYRWPDSPALPPLLAAKPALYVSEIRRDRHDLVGAHFSEVREIARIDRMRKGIAIAHYVVYRVGGFKGGSVGRMP